jgi:hypothetical protein
VSLWFPGPMVSRRLPQDDFPCANHRHHAAAHGDGQIRVVTGRKGGHGANPPPRPLPADHPTPKGRCSSIVSLDSAAESCPNCSHFRNAELEIV